MHLGSNSRPRRIVPYWLVGRPPMPNNNVTLGAFRYPAEDEYGVA